VLDLLEEKCYHTVFKLFRGLLFSFFCNITFSNVKMNVKIGIARSRHWTYRVGANFRKIGGVFSGRCVLELLQEKCYHTVFKLFRGLLFAVFCNSTFSNVKMNENRNSARRRRRTYRAGANFRQLGVNFQGDVYWIY